MPNVTFNSFIEAMKKSKEQSEASKIWNNLYAYKFGQLLRSRKCLIHQLQKEARDYADEKTAEYFIAK